jgi:hypothetical protein
MINSPDELMVVSGRWRAHRPRFVYGFYSCFMGRLLPAAHELLNLSS